MPRNQVQFSDGEAARRSLECWFAGWDRVVPRKCPGCNTRVARRRTVIDGERRAPFVKGDPLAEHLADRMSETRGSVRCCFEFEIPEWGARRDQP